MDDFLTDHEADEVTTLTNAERPFRTTGTTPTLVHLEKRGPAWVVAQAANETESE